MHRRPPESVVTQDQPKTNEVQTASKESPTFIRPDNGQEPTQDSRGSRVVALVHRWWLKLWRSAKPKPIVKARRDVGFVGSLFCRVSETLDRWFGKRRPVVDEVADQEIWFRAGSSLMALEVRSAPTGWNTAAAMPAIAPLLSSLSQDSTQSVHSPSTLERIDAGVGEGRVLQVASHPRFIRPEATADEATVPQTTSTMSIPETQLAELDSDPLDPNQWLASVLGPASSMSVSPATSDEEKSGGQDAGGGFSAGDTSSDVEASGGSGGAAMDAGKGETQQLFDLANNGAFDAKSFQISASPVGFSLLSGGGGSYSLMSFGDDCTPEAGIFEYALDSGSGPLAITYGPDGNFWYVEYNSGKIGMVTPDGTPSEWSIPTSNSGPADIAVGPDGNLWFTEFGTTKIGKITTSGTITEYTTGLTANSKPNGIVSGPDGNLWFTEFSASKIGKISTSGSITEYSLASGSNPISIVTGPDGNLWFASSGTNKIGKITTGGSITEYTIPTSGSVPWDIIVGPDNNIWFTQQGDNQIGVFDLDSATFSEFTIPTSSSVPWELAAGTDGNIWFAEKGSDKIGRIDTSGNFLGEFALPTSGGGPTGIVGAPDGSIWFTEWTGHKIGKLMILDVCGKELCVNTGSSFDQVVATFAAIDPTANFTVTIDWGDGSAPTTNPTITDNMDGTFDVSAPHTYANEGLYQATITVEEEYGAVATGKALIVASATQRITEYAVTSGGGPLAVINGPDGNYWFVEYNGNRLGKISPEGVVLAEYTIPTSNSGPADLTVGPDGNIWFTEHNANKIGKFDLSTGQFSEWSVPTSSSHPNGIVAGSDGALWFTEYTGNKIGRITVGGSITEYSTSGNTSLVSIASLGGYLWFAAAGTNKIVKMDTSGSVVAQYSVSDAWDVVVGPDNNIWFTAMAANKVGKVDVGSGMVTEYSLSGTLTSPWELTAGTDGNIWFAAFGSNRIGRMDPSNGTILDEYVIPTSSSSPTGIVGGPDGTIWFTEWGTHKIGRLAANEVGITATEPDAYEIGEVPGNFTIWRTGDTSDALTVYYTVSGSATPDDDYEALTGSVVIPAGECLVNLPVNPFLDSDAEVDERVIVRLDPGPGYVVRSPASATVTIHDTTVGVFAIHDTAEGGPNPGRFRFTRTGSTAQALTVYFNIGGSALPGFDYDRFVDSIIIPAGFNSVDLTVDAVDDSDIEGTEDLALTLFQDPLYVISTFNSSATIVILDNDSTNTWPMEAFILNWDPLTGQGLQQTGNNQVSYAVDLDRSPGIVKGGNSYLVYNSDFTDVRPIVQATIISDPSAGLPDQIIAELTWDGTAQTPVTFDTSNLVMGVPFTIAVQVEDAVTETDRYAWTLEVTIDYPGTSNDIVRTTSNETSFVVVQDVNNALGAGWSMSMVDRLYDIDSSNGPAGKLRVYGTGSWRFYEDTGGGTFASEPGDNGTLAASGGGYVYTTPDGQTWTFNSAGMQTGWSSADGKETLAFSYTDADSDGDTDDLQTVTSIDGGVATYTYSSNVLSSIAGAVRSYTFTHDGNKNLTTINTSGLGTQTYTYDTDADWLNHLEKEQNGQYFTDYAYTAGALTSSSRGGLYDMEYAPAALIGLIDPEMRPLEGSTQDAAMQSVWTMDERGRPLTYRDTSTGSALTIWNRDSTTYVQSMTDATGLTTTYTRDSDGDVTQEQLPDGSLRTYVYDTFGGNKRLKNTIDENGNKTTMLYDSAGHLTTYTNALNQTTVNAFDAATGLLLSTTDANGHITSFAYDASRRQTKVIEAFGTGIARTTTTTYDGGEVFNVIDPLGRTTSYGYDSAKQLTQVVEALGTADERRTTYTYDPAGMMTNSIDALGRISSYVYDAASRNIKTVEAFGTFNARSVQTAYDDASRVSTQTDSLNRATRFDYNVAQRSVTRSDADGLSDATTTTTRYNVVGNPLSAQSSLGPVSRWQYDSRHRATTMIQAQLSGAQAVTVTEFDPVGNVVSTIDAAQAESTVVYDGLNRAESVTIGAGSAEAQTVSLLYDDVGNLLSYTDGRGTVTSFAYNALDQQVTMIEDYGGLNLTSTYVYDAAGSLLSVTNPRGFTTSYQLDNLDRPKTTIEAFGQTEERRTTVVYDKLGKTVSTTDAEGTVTSYVYDSLDRVIVTIEALGTAVERRTTTVYDSVGNVLSVVDPRGFRATFAYDSLDRQTGMTGATGTTVERRTATQYDQQGNVTRSIDARGTETDYFYDDQYRVIRQVDAVDTSVERTTTFAYNAFGDLTSTTDPRGFVTTYAYDALHRQVGMSEAVGTADERSTQTLYDDAGNVVAAIDGLGHRTTFGYDALSRRTTVQDALGHVTTTLYDSAGNVTTMTDARGNTTTYAYDGLDRQTSMRDALGNVTTIVYDDTSNVLATVNARGFATSFTYDALHRQVSRKDALNQVTTTVYDANDNVVEQIDELGHRTTFTYDALNRQVTMKRPSGGVTTTVYDANDNVAKTIDPVGNVTTMVYDALNRETQAIDARGGVITNVYDANNNLVAQTDPVGNTTTFVFDGLNRQTKEIDPLGKTTTMVYDDADRMTQRIDRLARVKEFTYDDANRLTQEVWKTSGTPVNTLTYSHDDTNNMLTATDADGTITYTYDELNRVKTQKDVWNKTLTFTYDQVSNRTVVADSEGGLTTSTYDELDRLTRRDFTGQSTELRIDLTYTARSEVKDETRYKDLDGGAGNKIGSTSYTYDPTGRLTNLQHRDGSFANIANYTYTYDLADRITTEQLNGGAVKTYTYNARNELTNDSATTYSYDLGANRDMTGYATGASNRMTNDGVFTYTYDDEGNVTKKSKGSSAETWDYQYDHNNQLIGAQKRATDGGTLQMAATYVYDALNRRVEKQVWDGSSTTTRFTYDGDAVLLELDGGSSLTTRNLHGDRVLEHFARVSNLGAATWLYAERLGSIVNVVDSTGALIGTLAYDGYGKTTTETSPANSGPYGYAGYRRDNELSTIAPDRSARPVYDPATGRWYTEDPERIDGPNRYPYVRNNPTNLRDPSGRLAQKIDVVAIGGKYRLFLRHSGEIGFFQSAFEVATFPVFGARMAADRAERVAKMGNYLLGEIDPEEGWVVWVTPNKDKFVTLTQLQSLAADEELPATHGEYQQWIKDRETSVPQLVYDRTSAKGMMLAPKKALENPGDLAAIQGVGAAYDQVIARAMEEGREAAKGQKVEVTLIVITIVLGGVLGTVSHAGGGAARFLSRTQIIDRADNALQPLAKQIATKYPKAQVGFRGSLARGTKGAHKGGGPFDPSDFDVDAFVVSDDLAKLVQKNAAGHRNLGRLAEYQDLIRDASKQVKSIPGYRTNETFWVRVFSKDEFAEIVEAAERHFVVPK